uniref:Uncharacterized protein n=1 Tax=Anguilla anguilla TaxID=7936 RepID=A0A0E9XVA4_ANGAN
MIPQTKSCCIWGLVCQQSIENNRIYPGSNDKILQRQGQVCESLVTCTRKYIWSHLKYH